MGSKRFDTERSEVENLVACTLLHTCVVKIYFETWSYVRQCASWGKYIAFTLYTPWGAGLQM